ncbi:hypothetical protein [Denitrobaculum tricleocarpae]|uniref:Uncharacterized protein n=1 Tax=Denitrobaculum tricleocarpae TaxID=2591009 RepID=A0A545TTG2_9PROT|nr:hypothetical protein [Denitrobaculum tricleocarpae]TQV80509.1 hypothetical protein FKG95_10045 [Denitrobaculum tricleocarpae]
MKQKLALLVMAGALVGSMSFTVPVTAESASVAQLKLETQPKKPGTPTPTPVNPTFNSGINSTAPGGYAPAAPVVFHCMPGYSKTKYLKYQGGSRKGGLHTMECRSPIFECPAPSSVRTDNGSPAQGHGNTIKKVPVGAGDSNRFRIEYTCNYYWPEG